MQQDIDIGSEFEYGSAGTSSQLSRQSGKDAELLAKPFNATGGFKRPRLKKDDLAAETGKEGGRPYRQQFLALDAYAKHKKLMNDYFLNVPGAFKALKRDESRDKTDIDVIRENRKFLWEDESTPVSWEQKLAKKYYDKLFKEYCIADLAFYKRNKIALRWRIQKEVVDGKGQFICGNKRCLLRDGLSSWEVNFAYKEDGVRKNALVKLRLCPDCSVKLNYGKKRRKVTPPRGKASIQRVDLDSAENVDDTRPGPASKADADSASPASNGSESKSAADPASSKSEGAFWSQPVSAPEEDETATRETEMDSFLQDLLM